MFKQAIVHSKAKFSFLSLLLGEKFKTTGIWEVTMDWSYSQGIYRRNKWL
jgi:hypothetical protein